MKTIQNTKLKNNKYYLYFSYNNYNKENFIKEIIKKIPLNTNYSIIVKIGSESNTIFKMLGNQIGILIENNHDNNLYNNLYELIEDRIDIIYNTYNYIDNIETILYIFNEIKTEEPLNIKNINNFTFIKKVVNIKDVKKDFNSKFLPLTMDENKFGLKIIEEEKKEYINTILKINSNLDKNLFENNNILDIHINEYKNKKRIIISKKITTFTINRFIFDFNSKFLIKEITDTINNKGYSRKIGNFTLNFNNEKILNYKITTKLEPILPKIKTDFDRDIRFGSFDLETYIDSEGIAKVYALGFYVYGEKEPNLFYINKDLDSEELILHCLDTMLKLKYNNFIFYIHNFSRYDVYFIYNILLKANEKKGFNYYNLNPTFRDDEIINLNISKKKIVNLPESKTYTIKISLRDSMTLLNNSLENLTNLLESRYPKLIFPHKFVNEKTIFYIGNKPDIRYYIESKKDFLKNKKDKKKYEEISEQNWDLKKECLNYLKYDILGLFDIMEEFNRMVYINFNQQITNSLTITRLALNIFYKDFYSPKKKPIPYINKNYIFNFIKEGYYGGITEVYIPYGENLIYIDINSLYPYAALNDMPGINCEYIETLDLNNPLNLDELFGFFQAKIETNNQYIGLLPIRFNNKLILPEGKIEGIWSSEELKFAQDKGYKVSVIKGYNFEKITNNFKPFILKLYEKKKNSEGFIKTIYKSLLNNFLGRFALNFIKPITEIVSTEKRDSILTTKEVFSYKELSDNKYFITYNPIINKNICENHGIDYLKKLEKEFKLENNYKSFKDVSIPISALVNSYARICINNFKLEILKNKGKLYYSDTDSLVIDANSLNYIKEWIGDEIGKFKLVYEIKRAYFISNKTYCLILKDDNIIIKSKGVSNENLTEENFINMYLNNEKIKAFKLNSSKYIDKASVIINKKEIFINTTEYDKRKKIFNNQNIWIDTKPINIS